MRFVPAFFSLVFVPALRAAEKDFGPKEYLLPPSVESCAAGNPLGWSLSRCAQAFKAAGIFNELLFANQIPSLPLRFSDETSASGDFNSDPFPRLIIHQGLLDRSDLAIWIVVSHELGHWVQYREGLMARLDAGEFDHQQMEAHADWLGLRLTMRASDYDAPHQLAEMAALWGGCDKMAETASGHLARRNRWSNIYSQLEILATPPNKLETFRMILLPDIFDDTGARLGVEAPAPEEAVRQCRRLLAGWGFY